MPRCSANVLLLVSGDAVRAALRHHIEFQTEFVVSDEATSISDVEHRMGDVAANVAVVAADLVDGTALDFLRICEADGADLPTIVVSSSPAADPEAFAAAGAKAHLYLGIRGFNLIDLMRGALAHPQQLGD